MAWVRMPGILKRIYPDIFWNGPPDKKVLYLTFDDGPTPEITELILEMLARHHARATFFCIGRNVERHPEIFNRVVKAGHSVGNHTYSHLKGWYTSDKEYYADIALAGQFIASRLYRPAYGMITPAQIRYLKKEFTLVLWDVMSYDFHTKTTPEQCLRNVLRFARPGSVVVFHDSVKASEKVLFALSRVLEHFGELGYGFEGIGER
jgi:peptidoglycan/xylan/chitin deacetylase (PgdA/CDA1 family)